jgi:hypothetical protein
MSPVEFSKPGEPKPMDHHRLIDIGLRVESQRLPRGQTMHVAVALVDELLSAHRYWRERAEALEVQLHLLGQEPMDVLPGIPEPEPVPMDGYELGRLKAMVRSGRPGVHLLTDVLGRLLGSHRYWHDLAESRKRGETADG